MKKVEPPGDRRPPPVRSPRRGWFASDPEVPLEGRGRRSSYPFPSSSVTRLVDTGPVGCGCGRTDDWEARVPHTNPSFRRPVEGVDLLRLRLPRAVGLGGPYAPCGPGARVTHTSNPHEGTGVSGEHYPPDPTTWFPPRPSGVPLQVTQDSRGRDTGEVAVDEQNKRANPGAPTHSTLRTDGSVAPITVGLGPRWTGWGCCVGLPRDFRNTGTVPGMVRKGRLGPRPHPFFLSSLGSG